jgi:hypothetical protein
MMTAMQANAYVAAALVAVIASPAYAQSARKGRIQHAPQAAPRYGYEGQKRFTDPDPNIQFELMRQQQWRKGGA